MAGTSDAIILKSRDLENYYDSFSVRYFMITKIRQDDYK